MTTFDQILPIVVEVLERSRELVSKLEWLLINRDLNGRIRLIAPDDILRKDAEHHQIRTLYQTLADRIGSHAYPVSTGIIYEASRDFACQGTNPFEVAGFSNLSVLDRVANTSQWENIADVATGARRIVFFSIKGGVGRSTAIAASAWALAKKNQRVLVLDLDLESPGLSSALLPPGRQPKYGITDWLVEDLVGNGDVIINDIYSTSDLRTDGEIYLVPAHGSAPGEYVSKLGRVWMPKRVGSELPEAWSSRLARLVGQLERKIAPDVILIDSRAGIDEVAAACVTSLGAHTVLMFAIQGQQTWTGYRALFTHWQQRGVITQIRNRIQLVAGLVPDDDRKSEYLAALRADAYKLFESTYDEVEPGATGDWSFAEADDTAPHAPVSVRWNRGWYGLLSLQHRMVQIDVNEVNAVYGELSDFLERALVQEN